MSQLLHIKGFLLIILIIFFHFFFEEGYCQISKSPLIRYEFSQKQMGTYFRMVLYAPDDSLAKLASEQAFRRIEDLNGILSDYLPESELNQLSQTAGKGLVVSVSDPLWTLLNRSLQLSEQTKGAFDITVGPYISLWRRARRREELPATEAITKAKKAVGYNYLLVYPEKRAVQLMVAGMKLDMGAIGKGFAADEAIKVLQKLGINSALVDAGGDITVSEAPPGKEGWKIEIGLPDESSGKKVICLANAAIATSGDAYQYLEVAGKRYSHIVDPRTGIGLTNHSMVTVIAPDGTAADALASAISVLGPKKGKKLANKIPGIATRIVYYKNGQKKEVESKRFRKAIHSQLSLVNCH